MLGFVTDSGWQVVSHAAAFIATPVILHLLSGSLYGFWLTAISVLAYLGLVDLGFGISLTRIVAGTYNSSSDGEQLNRVCSSAFFLFCIAGLVFLVVGFGMGPYIPGWFKIPQSESAAVISAYKIMIIAGAIGLPLSTFPAIVSGTQHMAVTNTVRSLVSLVSLVFSIGLLYAGLGLIALALGNLINFSIRGLINYFYACRYCPNFKIRLSLINCSDIARLWSFGGYFQLGRIGEMVTTSADAILIGIILGAAAVTPYTLTSKLACLISLTLATKLPNALFPALCQMFAKNEMDKLRRSFVGLAYYSTRLAIVGSIFILLANRHFVSLWVGPQFFGGNFLNAIFVSWAVVNTIFHGVGSVLKASGDLRNWSIALVLEGVLNISISLLLIKPLGLAGVALGTTISRTLVTGIYVTVLTCRKVQISIWKFLLRGVFFPTLKSLPGFCAVVLFVMVVPYELGWLWLFLLGLIAFAGNVFSFECLQLLKSPHTTLKKRLWKILKLDSILD